MIGSTLVHKVEEGTVIMSDGKALTVTDDQCVYMEGDLFVTEKTWERLKAQCDHESSQLEIKQIDIKIDEKH